MSEQVLYQTARPRISTSRIILPTEHGSWSFLIEPLIVGSLIAVSAASPWIILMFTGAFFARQPLKIYFLSRNNPEAASASFRFLLIFLGAAGIGLGGTIWFSGPQVFIPLVIAAPLAMQQIYADVSRRGRNLWAELTGAVAISSSSAVLALAGGFSSPGAVALWLIFVCRFVPSILYVRNRLLLEKGKPYDRVQPLGGHFLSLGVIAVMVSSGSASLLTAAMFSFLLVRSIIGLSAYRTKMKAMTIGIWEVIYGFLTVISIIAGHYLGI
jgi:hypothetical protein